MSKPYSDDLRRRAVAAVESGVSRRQAAEDFSVGASSVIRWSEQYRQTGSVSAKLISRHWVITHGNGKVEEVRGPGVVGQQPVLKPGEHFEYTSGCVLETPRGSMHGTYQMHTPDGRSFDATIWTSTCGISLSRRTS